MVQPLINTLLYFPKVFYESKKPTVVGSAQFAFSGSSDDDDRANKGFKRRKRRLKKKNVQDDLVVHKGLVIHKRKRDDNCRVCKVLELRGDTLELYDGHFSNYPTGCPRYVSFNIEESIVVLFKSLPSSCFTVFTASVLLRS